jgi:large subunit ribosomal protein L13Ae
MKTLVIDGKSHLLGRLASVCAKELLNGRKIVIIRCEKIEISGKHIKNKFRLLSRFKKRTNTNPKHGPFHFRSPSQIFWKGLRGMLPHKTKKGTKALLNIRLFEGIPNALRNIKKMNFASALRINRLFPGRKFSNLGEIASEIGWTQKKFIIEAQKIKKFSRKTTSKVFYEKNYYNRKNLESENNFNEIVSGYLKGINPVNFTEMNDSFGGEKKNKIKYLSIKLEK